MDQIADLEQVRRLGALGSTIWKVSFTTDGVVLTTDAFEVAWRGPATITTDDGSTRIDPEDFADSPSSANEVIQLVDKRCIGVEIRGDGSFWMQVADWGTIHIGIAESYEAFEIDVSNGSTFISDMGGEVLEFGPDHAPWLAAALHMLQRSRASLGFRHGR